MEKRNSLPACHFKSPCDYNRYRTLFIHLLISFRPTPFVKLLLFGRGNLLTKRKFFVWDSSLSLVETHCSLILILILIFIIIIFFFFLEQTLKFRVSSGSLRFFSPLLWFIINKCIPVPLLRIFPLSLVLKSPLLLLVPSHLISPWFLLVISVVWFTK